MEWKKNVNTNLGITIILVFAAVFTIIDFYAIGSHVDGYPFNELSGNTNSNDDNNNVENKEVVEVENEKSTDDLIFDCTFSEDYCLLLDEDNRKLEYYNWDSDGNWSPKLVVNGNAIELGSYRLDHYEFTDDDYLFISCSSGTGNGRPAYFLISDLKGNVITNIEEKSLKDGLYNYYVSFENGVIIYYAYQFEASVEDVCNERLGITDHNMLSVWNDSDTMYAKDVYQYVGSGKVSRINRIQKTFGEYMKDLTGYNSCQDAINDIDSWKVKGQLNLNEFYK